MRPDEAAVREVYDAIGGRRAITQLITGHSHFDHSFDTPVWANLTGAPIMGSRTTCLQAAAARHHPPLRLGLEDRSALRRNPVHRRNAVGDVGDAGR